MRKRLYRVLIALTMIAILFVSGCGNNTSDSETFPTETESTEEPTKESKEEIESESTEEQKEEESTENEKIVEDGEYKIYPAFIKTFTLEDNVLKVETENAFEDYEIPTEMAINFEYPLSDEIVWSDTVAKITDEEGFDWYEWFSFYLEGVTMAAERYNKGQYEGVYISGEDFCEKNAIWTIVIKDKKVVSISMDFDNADAEKSENAQENKASTETTNSAQADETKETNASTSSNPTESVPTSEPVHQHTWVERYDTIYHEAQGEWQQVQVGTSGDVYICNACGAEFGSAEEQRNHLAALVGIDNDHVMRGGTTIRDGQPIYEQQFVETSPAWTETVVVGYSCSCGATK